MGLLVQDIEDSVHHDDLYSSTEHQHGGEAAQAVERWAACVASGSEGAGALTLGSSWGEGRA